MISARFVSLIILALVSTASTALANVHSLPDHNLTPGATFEEGTLDEICTPGYSKGVRNVTAETKREVYAEYGLAGNHTGYCDVDQGCEIDHLISLELGGSNEPANLWPEPYTGIAWNAHVKDILENRLHEMVCARELPLEEAQREIATDWIATYHRYVEGMAVALPVAPTIEQGTTHSELSTPSQFQSEECVKTHCPEDQVVWANLKTDVLHLPGSRWYGATRAGAYVCLGEAQSAGWRLAANGQ